MPGWSSPLLALLASAVTLAWLLGPGRARLPMDRPNERSLHQIPVPRSGGLAVMAGVLAACLPGWPTHAVLVAGALVLAALSFADDWRGMPIVLRFGVHAACAAAFTVLALPALSLPVQVATAFLIVWAINLYNFMDGSDGLAGGMAVFGFGTFAAAFAIAGDGALATLSLGIAIASAVFLKANFHPARIFLGDVGSVPLGFLAGALGAVGIAAGHFAAWFPFVVFAPFFVDATSTLLRRLLRGERFWQAHREHYYQRLVRMGWGHRRTAMAEYALMAASAASALVALYLPPVWQATILGGWAMAIGGSMLAIDRHWATASAERRPRV
jgi:UDP-N-acetylmuramyl pentapeptide phosphotransferase/UDP-N-acetylglucosamine-1-phosphate transferase